MQGLQSWKEKDHIIKLIPQEATLAPVHDETEAQALKWTATDVTCPISKNT